MVEQKLRHYFIRDKPTNILLCIKNNKPMSITSLSKRTDTTHSYVATLLRNLSSKGLVRVERRGRVVTSYLTERGIEVSNALEKFLELIDRR